MVIYKKWWEKMLHLQGGWNWTQLKTRDFDLCLLNSYANMLHMQNYMFLHGKFFIDFLKVALTRKKCSICVCELSFYQYRSSFLYEYFYSCAQDTV